MHQLTDFLRQIPGNKKLIVCVFVAVSLVAGIQSLLITANRTWEGPRKTYYNNYTIFKYSFVHLTEGENLYSEHPDEHMDLFKYTPTFAALFGIFAILPDWLGLNLWNLLNTLVLVLAIYSLPFPSHYRKGLILLTFLIELLTSLQNAQSNGLMAGLLILSSAMMERGKPAAAGLMVALSAFIKLFGIAGVLLLLLYPRRGKAILFAAGWMALLALLPLMFTNFSQYLLQIREYGNMLSHDHTLSYGYSVMGWLHSWFGAGLPKNAVVATGFLILILPFSRRAMYSETRFRMFLLASLLIWVVIFNHKAESPTFIIAMAGVCLWFFGSEKNGAINWSLFLLAVVLTMLSPTDFFPAFIREEYVKPYALKGFPCILIWMKITVDLLRMKKSQDPLCVDGSVK